MSTFEVKVRKITEIKEHPNADKLEIVRVDGFDWDVITGKDLYKVGDLVVYVPMDSVLSDKILKGLDQKVSIPNGRIRAARIRGVVSYGMLLPISGKMKYGDEVSKELGITKYEQPFTNRYKVGGSKPITKKRLNPLFDKYTDIEHLKYYPQTFIKEDGTPDDVVIESKVHGTSWRVGHLPRPTTKWYHKIINFFFGDYEFCVGSRQVQQKLDGSANGKTWLETTGKINTNVYIEMFNRLKCKEWLPKDTIIYGEIYGDGIQDLTYGYKDGDISYMIYDVKVGGRYLSVDERNAFCEKFGLTIPVEFYRGKWGQDVLEHRKGMNVEGKEIGVHVREGVIVRPVKERYDDKLGRVVLKVINEYYLTRDNGTEFQ